MTKAIKALTLAAVIALPGALHAQSMGQGYDMLTAALVSDFERLGIEPRGLDSLTLGQLSIIRSILASDATASQQKGRIESIIANN
ncbi:MAG: hypothetical protein AAF366_17580 [Pseudomonadota bacterium]